MIVAYVRVSTDEQAKSGLGLEDQQKTVAATVSRLGLQLRVLIIDDGHTAGVDLKKRPKLLEAIGCLQPGDVLLVVKRDRLSRGDPVAMAEIEREVARRKAMILSAAGEGTWGADSSAMFERRMHDAFAERELVVIGERTRAALRAKRERGEVAGAVPFGYRAVIDWSVRKTKRGLPGRRLVPVKAEQEAIVVMRERRKAGLSLRRVGDELIRLGFKPKKGGKRWCPASIRGILGEAKPRFSVYGSPTLTSEAGRRGQSPTP